MDLQTGLVCIAVVVISAAVIVLISMFGIKEKSYEEAIAEQRKLPDDLLLSKKDKNKDKKHKNKAGKKVKEKKEEKEEKQVKEEKPEHVHFEENPQILPLEPLTRKENLQQLTPTEAIVNKSPKETPTKSKKNVKDATKKKDENVKEEKKDEKKEAISVIHALLVSTKDSTKEIKDQKESLVKDVKEVAKESVPSTQLPTKESKKTKRKNDILAQIGGDKDAVNVSLLMPLVQKAELSRSEIQILIDQLLNKQMDNPAEHSEWTEGRADPVIKLKKQLAEKEKALADEHEANIAFQNKLKELRTELNSEKSRLTANVRQLGEALNTKIMETQTLHTRMQHILESHAAEKQGLTRQIEQLQAQVNENAALVHKMQEDQGQTQGQLQELIKQRKQMEVQFAQMHENENALKAQLAQKLIEVEELQSELEATCENSTEEIEMLRQQLGLMQDQLMHSEGQLQHFKETGDRLQNVARQLEESHRAHADLDHRLKNAHRHEHELQKQVNSLQSELNAVKAEANDASALKAELNKTQSELLKLKAELPVSVSEAKSEAAEITALKMTLVNKEEELKKSQEELNNARVELTQRQQQVDAAQKQLEKIKMQLEQSTENLLMACADADAYESDMYTLKNELEKSQVEIRMFKAEMGRLKSNEKQLNEAQLQTTRLQEENDRLSAEVSNVAELQKQIKELQEENESLASQLASTTERPAAEGRENGIGDNVKKHTQFENQYDLLLTQKDCQLNALKTELRCTEAEFIQFNNALRRDLNNQCSLAKRLHNDLETQKAKNNELRMKNWKVMEALSAAESRIKSNSSKNVNQVAEDVKAEQELTKNLLQRIFPEIKVSEKSHDQWLRVFEEKVNTVLTEFRKTNTIDTHLDLEKQNKNLQDMVAHYKQIIDDTEGMLNKLQSHVESEETRWETQLRQKENEIANLRVELNGLMNKLNLNVKLQEKVTELEIRLKDTESLKEQASAELLALRSTSKSDSGEINSHDLATLEKLQEEKARLSEELQAECSKRAAVDAELDKLRSIVTQLHQKVSQLKGDVYTGCSSSEQSTLNGPPTTECSNSEGGSGKK